MGETWRSAAAAEWSDSTDAENGFSSSFSHSQSRQRGRHERSITPYRVDISNGVTICWRNISCFAPEIGKGWCGRTRETGRYKQLLFDVHGVVQPSTFLAIMGASGAGKSTLLNILTCRNLGNLHVDGQVKVNGVDMGANIKSVSAYVQQEDIFWGRLTVREHLIFNAVLRMGRAYTTREQLARVEEVLIEMGLDRIANEHIKINRAGRSSYGISGSERKLLSIASELLTDPALIFCDEPTTGLDAMMAEHVVRLLHRLAQKGKTVLCTIHQPASHIFSHFDQLFLLAEGRLAFHGTTLRSLEFFFESGMACPPNYNPADHFIHTLAIKPGSEAECKEKVVFMATRFQATPECQKSKQMIKAIDKMAGDPEFESVLRETSRATPYRATWWNQVKIATWKMTLDQVRDPAVMLSRVIQNFCSIIIMSILYFQQSYNQVGVMNINGSAINIILHITFLPILQLSSFCAELGIFYRDHHNGLYRTDTFFIAKNLAEIPIFAIFVSSSVTILYWLIGYYSSFEQFMVFTMAIILNYQFSLAINVYVIGIICGRLDLAINVAPPMRMLFMLLAGYFVNDASIPAFISWLKYLSWQRYTFRILMVNQWSKVDHIECETGIPDVCYKTGQDVLDFLNFNDYAGLGFDFLMLVVIGLIYRLLAYVVLWFKAKERKRN